jgi:hypothetical protein
LLLSVGYEDEELIISILSAKGMNQPCPVGGSVEAFTLLLVASFKLKKLEGKNPFLGGVPVGQGGSDLRSNSS